MSKVLKRPLAESDLDDIWFYIAQDNICRADTFVDRIGRRCHLLAEQPYMGEVCEEVAPNLRKFPIGNYVIYYCPAEDGVEIVRVLHGARDVETLF